MPGDWVLVHFIQYSLYKVLYCTICSRPEVLNTVLTLKNTHSTVPSRIMYHPSLVDMSPKIGNESELYLDSCKTKKTKKILQIDDTNFTVWAWGARWLLRILKANVKLLLKIGAAQIIRNILQVIVCPIFIQYNGGHMIFKFWII